MFKKKLTLIAILVIIQFAAFSQIENKEIAEEVANPMFRMQGNINREIKASSSDSIILNPYFVKIIPKEKNRNDTLFIKNNISKDSPLHRSFPVKKNRN